MDLSGIVIQERNMRQVSELLVVVEAVTNDKLVRHLKPLIVDTHLYAPSGRFG